MADVSAKSKIKHAQIGVTVIRADGTREELGVVSDSSWRWCLLLGPWRARRRIARANRRTHEGTG